MDDPPEAPVPAEPRAELERRAREAVARADWAEARTLFEAVRACAESPETCEEFAWVCRMLHDFDAAFVATERAYTAHRNSRDMPAAALAAVWMAGDCADRGEMAVALGWLGRAKRHLQGVPECEAHGWATYFTGYVALMAGNDAAEGRLGGAEAAEIGRRLNLLDLEMMGLALEGLSLVSEGAIAEGMAKVDEAAAAAIAGGFTNPNWRGTVCCCLVDACGRVRDYDRTLQWRGRMKRIFDDELKIEGFFSLCRPGYAQAMLWRGSWAEAESELEFAVRELSDVSPPYLGESLVRLAELRLGQDRLVEAEALFAQVEGDPLSLPGRSHLAAARGDVASAVDLAERYLRHLPPSARAERATGLEALVPALLACNRAVEATAAAEELGALAELLGTRPFRTAAAMARGLVESAHGEFEGARRAFEDALDLSEKGAGAYETAHARVELARTLIALGRPDAGLREATLALDSARMMGAARLAASATALLGPLSGEHPGGTGTLPAGLSLREAEVLSYLARGLSNQEIAAALVLSVRTVERHISNIYTKVNVSGPSARAAAASFAAENALARPMST